MKKKKVSQPAANRRQADIIQSEVISGMPEGAIVSATVRRGPLPDPETLAHYGEILPDAPHRILCMAEKEQDRSIYMSQRFDAYKSRGQHYALIIVLAAFSLHAFLAYLGHEALGFVVSGSALLSVVGAFIYGERKKKE
jgi:uncharacterized membrane protein